MSSLINPKLYFMLIIFGSITFLLFAFYLYLNKIILQRLPSNYPTDRNIKKKDFKKSTLVCFGDSNTHGNVSFNWVAQLQKKKADINIFNAGINGDLTFTLLNRIDPIIDCKPDLICILIGTNDVNATLKKSNLVRYVKMGKIDNRTSPNIKNFEENYRRIIELLQEKTKAKIALLSLPLISEDLNHSGNIKANNYSKLIKKLVDDYELDFLDFRSIQIAMLPKEFKSTFWSYKRFRLNMLTVVFIHYLFRVSWNTGAQLFGKSVTSDNIHLNESSGKELENLVLSWASKNTP